MNKILWQLKHSHVKMKCKRFGSSQSTDRSNPKLFIFGVELKFFKAQPNLTKVIKWF